MIAPYPITHDAPLPPSLADERTRIRLASATDTEQTVLLQLATDQALTVRVAVAMNEAASIEVNRLLASDRDARIRALLARKLAALLAALPAATRSRIGPQARVHAQVLTTLETLVADEAVRVRAAIADVVKDLPGVPRGLILTLVRDTAMLVAEPVIRLSPLLTSEDLLALIAAPPVEATLLAIAGRKQIGEPVTDALASASNAAAVAVMLANPTAAIREATLDALVARASHHAAWHAPMVRHPHLSSNAAMALSTIVAEQLLDELAARADLDQAVSTELRRRLEQKLRARADRPPQHDEYDAMAHARCLLADGQLDEPAVLAAIERSETILVGAMLAVSADLPYPAVERAITMRSAKAMVSLLWRGNFTMQLAGPAQCLLLGAAPGSVLCANPRGGFPLALEEMRWQIEYLTRMAR